MLAPTALRPDELIEKKVAAKLQFEILAMPIQDIEAFVPNWKLQRRFYSTSVLSADYQRGTITRSILCEYLHTKGILLSTRQEHFMDPRFEHRDVCLALMEMTTWMFGANLRMFSTYATEDLLWGQALERGRPGIFDRLLQERRTRFNTRNPAEMQNEQGQLEILRGR